LGHTVTTDEFDGEPDGVLFRVGELNAESITFGARSGPVRSGLGSAEVPWGRLADRIRGRGSPRFRSCCAAQWM